MEKIKINSHQEYQNFLEENANHNNINDIEYYLKKSIYLNKLMDLMPSASYIVNYKSGKYLFFSKSIKNIIGFDADVFLKKNQTEMMKKIHPDDIAKISKYILPSLLNHVANFKKEDITNFVFSLNYRVKRADGSYVHLLQRTIIIESGEDNLPILNMSNLTDITNYKSDNKVYYTVSRFDDKEGYKTILNELVGEDNLLEKLSEIELGILALYAAGYSAKEIAEKQFKSPLTVKGQIRSIKKKLAINKATELVKFAISNGITSIKK